jgi:hypothetical protein
VAALDAASAWGTHESTLQSVVGAHSRASSAYFEHEPWSDVRSQAADGAGVEGADADVSLPSGGASPSPSATGDDDPAAARATPATPANAKRTPAAVTVRAEEDDAPRASLPLSRTSAAVSSARDGIGTMLPRPPHRALFCAGWTGWTRRDDERDEGRTRLLVFSRGEERKTCR